MRSDFIVALTQLASERHLPKDRVLGAIEAALASAFRKDSIAAGQDVSVKLNPNTGEVSVSLLKTVVEEVTDPKKEISLKRAKVINPNIELGENLEQEAVSKQQASRIAAQTAKQVVLQRLKEAERELIFEEFAKLVNDMVSATVSQVEHGRLILDTGRGTVVLPQNEQIPMERYRRGQRLKVFIIEATNGTRGPEIIVSRTHRDLIKRLFETEVPEIQNGIVEIRAIAREPGSRSKLAVSTTQQGVDPIGSCIGMRGNRIQNVVSELHGEKIDVLRWDKDPKIFIKNALSPSEVVHVELNADEQSGIVVVPERQLSLAIGREGQNARLAAKLTGWHLDIISMSEWETKSASIEPNVSATTIDDNNVPQADVVTSTIEPSEDHAEHGDDAVVLEDPETVEEPVIIAQEPIEDTDSTHSIDTEESLSPVGETSDMSAEEELLALEDQEEDEEAQENVDATPIDQDVWKVPVINPGVGQIRFAEDVVDNPVNTQRRKNSGPRRPKKGNKKFSSRR